MKQLGKVSGKIYEDDFQTEILVYQECCSAITDEQAQDKVFIKQQREKTGQNAKTV